MGLKDLNLDFCCRNTNATMLVLVSPNSEDSNMLTTERLSKYINRLDGAITFVFEGWNIQNGAIVHPIKMYIARGDGVLFVTANRDISPPVLEGLMPGELINFTEVPTL